MAGEDLLPFEVGQGGRRKRAITTGELLMRQGGDTSPAPSKAAAYARLLAGAAGGIFSRIEDQKAEDSRKALAAALMGAIGPAGGAAPVAAGGAPVSMGAAPMGGARPTSTTSTGPLNPTARTIYDGLTQRGVPSIVAAGMVGNIAAESNFNPGIADGRGEGSVGLIQARGPRLAALQSMAAERGVDFRKDTGVQLDHIVSELNGSENKAYQIAQQATTPGEAALALAKHYERPAAWALAQSGPRRASVAEQIYRAANTQNPADLPAAGAKPIGFDAMGGASDGMGDQGGGFIIPPGAPEVADPPMPSDLATVAPAAPAFDPSALASALTPSFSPAVAPDPAPMAGMDLRGTIAPDAPATSAPSMVDAPALDLASAPVDAPLPPGRPAGLDVMPAVATAPPLPPSRPDFASMPAVGATATSGPSPQALAAALQAPDSSNSRDAGAGDFARGYGLAGLPGPPLLVSNPMGGAPSASPQRLAQALAPVQGGSPVAGEAPAQGASQGMAPVSGQRAALAAILASPDASDGMKTWALTQLSGPKESFGFQTLADGTVLRTDQRRGTVEPVYTAPKPPTYGVIGQDQYGNSQYGFIDPTTRQVQPTAPQQGGGQTLPGQPGSSVPAPPPGVDPKIWREGQSKQAVSDALPVDSKVTAELRKEVLSLPSYKNVTQAQPIYAAMADAAGRNTKASDLNLIYGLGKIMDPGSVVREGEMVMANDTQGVGDRLNGMIKSINGGARLQPEVRQALMQEAYGRMNAYHEAFNADAQHYTGIATRGRMNVQDVVPTFNPAKPWELPKPAPSPTQTPGGGAASSVPQAAGGMPTGAKQAPDGNWYVKQGDRYMRVVQ